MLKFNVDVKFSKLQTCVTNINLACFQQSNTTGKTCYKYFLEIVKSEVILLTTRYEDWFGIDHNALMVSFNGKIFNNFY